MNNGWSKPADQTSTNWFFRSLSRKCHKHVRTIDKFSILHLNIRSLKTNIGDFRKLLATLKWTFQCYCSYKILLWWNCKWELFIEPIETIIRFTKQEKELVFTFIYTKQLQSFTKYLRLTLVFMRNSVLQKKINFCFSRVFSWH